MQSGRKAICLIHKTKGTGKGVGGFWSQEEKGRERERPVGASWKRSLGCFDPSGGEVVEYQQLEACPQLPSLHPGSAPHPPPHCITASGSYGPSCLEGVGEDADPET